MVLGHIFSMVGPVSEAGNPALMLSFEKTICYIKNQVVDSSISSSTKQVVGENKCYSIGQGAVM